MKRVHVPELEDESWFPSTLRTSLTNLLAAFARAFGVIPVLSSLVSRALKTTKLERVVDLCSGAGGSMPQLIQHLRNEPGMGNVELVMTDKFPNLDAVERLNDPGRPYMKYARESVDATALASAPAGLKTMVNSFHHMRPPQARAILESAHRERQPILIYEMADNEMPFALWLIALPIALPILIVSSLLLTFMVRPLTARQLLFTFLIPVVPLCYAWDGQASVPRIYTLGDMDELIDGLKSADYVWEKGYAKTARGKNKGIYLLGLPAEPQRSR